jgi:hypothetical protein
LDGILNGFDRPGRIDDANALGLSLCLGQKTGAHARVISRVAAFDAIGGASPALCRDLRRKIQHKGQVGLQPGVGEIADAPEGLVIEASAIALLDDVGEQESIADHGDVCS